ncbi:MAG: YihY/virulence factor BrkB family protein [Methylococcaceae bacterium]
MISTVVKYFKHDIWHLSDRNQSFFKARFIKYTKIMLMAIHGFLQDNCQHRAAALTLYTLLSIVPVLAMSFGLAKGFGLDSKLEKQIMEQTPEQSALLEQVVTMARNLLDNTQGGLVAGIGIIVLLFTVIKVIGNIEEAFNHIWKVKKGRSIARKLTDYLSIVLLAPFLLVLSSSITLFIKTKLIVYISQISGLEYASDLLLFLLKFSPFVIMWLLFTFLYMFMPNTRIELKSGLLAGVLMGTVYQLFQMAYVNLQVNVSSYNAIYGSFAALPLFLIWLQISWMVILFGAELGFFHQNYWLHEDRYGKADLSISLKKVLALDISHLLVKNFIAGKKPLTISAIAKCLRLPISHVQNITEFLVDCGILSTVQLADQPDPAFQPACDTNWLSLSFILEAIEEYGDNQIPATAKETANQLQDRLRMLNQTARKSVDNLLLKDL